MNEKGFTLIELLATIVILGIVTTITLTMGTNIFAEAKNKEQQTFVDRLTNSIGDLVTMYSSDLTLVTDTKVCQISKNKADGSGSVTQTLKHYTVPLKNLMDRDLVNKDIINPKTEKKCYDNTTPIIHVYKDEDLVVYYYIKLDKCIDDADKQIVNTLPTVIDEGCLPNA